MLETALLISNRQELLNFLNSIAQESFIENITRPDTKWKIIQISNLIFYINHLQDAPLGAPIPLPDFIMNNHGLANVSAEDSLCFFDAWSCSVVLTFVVVIALQSNCFMNIVPILT